MPPNTAFPALLIHFDFINDEIETVKYAGKSKGELRTVKNEQDRFLEWRTNQTFHSIETIIVQETAK